MQQDRFEPTAGQAIPYEDYSGIGAATTEEEEAQERDMKHPKPPHHQKQQRSSRKRSISSSSSDSSRSSSSSSVLSSSDDSSSEGGGGSDTRVAPPPKKKKRKKKTGAGSAAHEQKPKKGRQQNRRRTETTTATDDGSINKLISVALRSQKKQYKNQIIESVKSDLMNTLRSRIVQHQQREKKKKRTGGDDDDEEGGGGGEDIDATDAGGGVDKQYRKRIKQAYKEHEEGYDDAPKFNSKQHKKTIGSILSKLGEVNDIELFRIPHIDKEMGLDRMDIGGGGSGRDNKLTKKMLSASPEKTIPEAVYAALKDAYSSCVLYKYFFRRIYPYLTVPYISK